ncbi:RagB/SusD family nutrient uptake outer membrane protein [Niabella drilacis]|uniref:Starch-binding associating with outer membrane n=1 Tax=Niabella drilacis (strain DSM 25811 / CCM 8410 / CCUG 62505 / LMG 26954 / E90) TaxID=1285928 RepID=A0A1G6S9L7_NIADE|nr:RagB/SusD family nutrient uptake outer membrane protein [Niabella drilacis]SDD12807.1 Starch-binding associating with outer membrane [Niabella drilacis]
MKNYYIPVALLASLLFLPACEKLIDIKPESAITAENYWNAEGDVIGYLTGIYSKYRDVMNNTYYLEDRGDAFSPGLESGMSSAWQQNLTPQNAPNWLDFYNVVHHCNLVLKYAPGITFTQEADKNRILAQTRFIRAHIYFTLLRSWGDVPVVTVPTESAEMLLPARAKASDVAAFILKDIDEAINTFPEDNIRNKDLASKQAAYALKADVLLWKAKVLGGDAADLTGVIDAADKASAGLNLEEDFSKIFSTDNRKGKEVLFALHFAKDEKSDQYSKQLKPRDLFVQAALNKNDIPYAVSGARSQYAPSDKLQQAFKVNANDKRTNASLITAVGANNAVIGVFDNKMRGTLYPDNRYYDNDIIVYRLGELILFKAEALAALGRTEDAITELDKIRVRAGTGNYKGATDKLSVEREILNERFRELYLELKRWPDLLRFHFEGVIDVRAEVANMNATIPLFFPIPKAQIDINSNLTQTEGY